MISMMQITWRRFDADIIIINNMVEKSQNNFDDTIPRFDFKELAHKYDPLQKL